MAYYPISDPEPVEPIISGESQPAGTPRWTRGTEPPSFESDLAKLIAKFSSAEGGNLSAALSADLALEVVLNEMVEQARHLTGASGAAVILERDGEWVCRASSGVGAPELGARLGSKRGLTEQCIRTGQVQRSDDTETDARVDVEACRNLGVHSVITIPVLHGKRLVGVLAAFSPRVCAFGEADERNLRELSSYVSSSLALACEPRPIGEQAIGKIQAPVNAVEENGAQTPVVVNFSNGNSVLREYGREDRLIADADPARQFETQPEIRHGRRGLKIATWILTGMVLAFAVFLTLVASQRFLGSASGIHRSTTGAVPGGLPGAENANGNEEIHPAETAKAGSGAGVPVGPTESARATTRGPGSQSQEGGLIVYENGKEIFRMTPAPAVPKAIEKDDASSLPPSATESTGIPELSPDAAEDSVLYRVEAEYPESARKQKIQGAVVLEVWARPDGSVRSVTPLSGEPSLSEAAIAAVKQWKFKPHLVNGEPMEMRTRVTLNFKLPAM
jgi:TonB family protein